MIHRRWPLSGNVEKQATPRARQLSSRLSGSPGSKRRSALIIGSHVIIYTRDAEADRSFFRDILRMPAVDAGEGWLIFALPPSEVAFHPADRNNSHALYLMSDDLVGDIRELEGRGARCDKTSEQTWGITTEIHLPGGGRIGLYQPKHSTAIQSGH